MSLHAYVNYSNDVLVDSAGERTETWRASIKLREPITGMTLGQTYAATLQSPRQTKQPLADGLTISAGTLDEATEFATAAIEELTGIQPIRTRSVDLRHLNARPAVFEEYKVAKDARQGIQKAA